MRNRFVVFYLIVLIGAPSVSGQEDRERFAYTPSAVDEPEIDPLYRKMSPELRRIVRQDWTFIGMQENGQIAVEGARGDANFAGADKMIPDEYFPEESREILVSYAPGQRPTDAEFRERGFVVVDTNTDANLVVVAAVEQPANLAPQTSGVQREDFIDLASMDGAEYVDLNMVFTIPEHEIEDEELVPPLAASSSSELDLVPGVKRTGAHLLPEFQQRSEIVVAVIDTGVDFTHSDLHRNMWVNSTEANGRPGIDDDDNGVVDDIYGASFIANQKSGNPMDDNGHGTHCAGTIGAVANGTGVIGMSQCRLMAVRFLHTRPGGRKPEGELADAIRAIDYARKKNADVISCSWGGFGTVPRLLEEAIGRAKDAGILVVVAAGNDNANIDRRRYSIASSKHENVVAVGSVNRAGGRSEFSNFGPQTVDIAASGGTGGVPDRDDIYSTWLNGGYRYLYGTSMATPHVSGAAALLLSHPRYRNSGFAGIRQLLEVNGTSNQLLANFFRNGRELDVRFAKNDSATQLAAPDKVPPSERKPEAYADSNNPSPNEAPVNFAPASGASDVATKDYYGSAHEFSGTYILKKIRLRIPEKAIIHLSAGSSVAGAAGDETFTTGINIGDVDYDSARRFLSAGRAESYQNITTTLTVTLPAGTHDVKWWVKVRNGGRLLLRGGVSLNAQAFAIRE